MNCGTRESVFQPVLPDRGAVAERVGLVRERSEGFLGALERTNGYRAAGVPAVGTFLMAASLRVADRETAVPLPAPVQLPVPSVEHHLVPERGGRVPSWCGQLQRAGTHCGGAHSAGLRIRR